MLICALFLFSCSSKDLEPTADELYFDGITEFADKNYTTAIEKFEKLIDFYPFDKRAISVELKIADAYFYSKKYKLAAYSYEDFENMHPTHHKLPYVIQQIALSYFNQIDTIDRDPSFAHSALNNFNRLIKEYPDLETYGIQENIQFCFEHIASYEVYVADYLFKTKQYKAALVRYENIEKEYSKAKASEGIQDKIAKTNLKLSEAKNPKKKRFFFF